MLRTPVGLTLQIALVVFMCQLTVHAFAGADQRLLQRPREKWEQRIDATFDDVDHLALGWDQIYLGDRSHSNDAYTRHYPTAENEFWYVIEYIASHSAANNYPMVNHQFLGAVKGLAEVGFRTGRPLLAKPIYERAVKETVDNPDLYAHYATYLKRIGSRPEAVEAMKNAVRLAPGDAGLQYQLGLLYLENRQFDLAERQAQQLEELGLGPDNLLRQKLNQQKTRDKRR